MDNIKEKVLSYFDNWTDEGVNPHNGYKVCGIDEVEKYDGTWGLAGWEIKINDTVALFISDNEKYQTVEGFLIAARLLILDQERPKVAEIVWEEDADGNLKGGSYYEGGVFKIRARDIWRKIWVAYQDDVLIREFGCPDSREVAKIACQKRKQYRYDRFGGWGKME